MVDLLEVLGMVLVQVGDPPPELLTLHLQGLAQAAAPQQTGETQNDVGCCMAMVVVRDE